MIEGKSFIEEGALLLEEIILNRGDIRGNYFVDKQLTDECMDRLIEVAVNAPSVGFTQPWGFVVISDKTIKQQIKESFESAQIKETEFLKMKNSKRVFN